LQLRRLELESEKETRAYELEAEEKMHKRQLEHKLEIKRLELAAQAGAASADDRRQAHAFGIDTAVKLIPKFNEYDVESFLLSFEKMAQLNQLKEDKYAAILQAHLTGKALRSLLSCQSRIAKTIPNSGRLCSRPMQLCLRYTGSASAT